MTVPNGLRSDKSWLLVENKTLREMLEVERERRRLAEQEFRRLEDRMERNLDE